MTDIPKLAALARLAVSSPDQLVRYQESFVKILAHFEKLATVDVSNVSPLSHPNETDRLLRADVPQPSLDIKAVLSEAPDTSGHYFRVPIIIEQG